MALPYVTDWMFLFFWFPIMIKKRRYSLLKIISALVLLALFTWATMFRDSEGPTHPSWTGTTMGSAYSIKLADSSLSKKQLESLKKHIEACLEELNRQMSTYRPDSEISRFNSSTSTGPFAISPTFAGACTFALALSRQTDGIFDPTLDPLINLWGFGHKSKAEGTPNEEQIRQAQSIIGFQHLSILPGNVIQKDIPELQLNLNSFVPGLAADEVARVIEAAGVTNLFVEIGGEVMAIGHNANGTAWKIGIEKPDPSTLPGEALEAVVQLSDKAIATSGDYRSYFTDADGQVYSHILNPKTGRPVKHRLASVSVVAKTCMVADALATALFAMGPDAAPEWLKQHSDVEALFIIRNEDGRFSEVLSPGFSESTGYKLVDD